MKAEKAERIRELWLRIKERNCYETQESDYFSLCTCGDVTKMLAELDALILEDR